MPPTIKAEYRDIRWSIRQGDTLAFVGRTGFYSRMIRIFTGRPTHVAPISWIEDDAGTPRVKLVEALEGKGVIASLASERIESYDGEVYLLRLDPAILRDAEGIGRFLDGKIGTGYSLLEAILSAPGQWFRWPGKDRASALFCSEIDRQSKVYGGRISKALMGKDETPTPAQLVRLPIWKEFVQLKGDFRPL